MRETKSELEVEKETLTSNVAKPQERVKLLRQLAPRQRAYKRRLKRVTDESLEKGLKERRNLKS